MRGWLPSLALLFTVAASSVGQAQQKAADDALWRSVDGGKQKTESEPQGEQWSITGMPATMFYENDDPKKYQYQDIVTWSVHTENAKGNTLNVRCFGNNGIYISLSGSDISKMKIEDLGKISSYSEFSHPYFNVTFSIDDDMKYNMEMTPRDPLHVALEWSDGSYLRLSAVYDEDKLHFLRDIASAKRNISVELGGKTYIFKTAGAAEPLNELLKKCKNPDNSTIYSKP
ncbi:hypothetical protein [Labrys neptuniae]